MSCEHKHNHHGARYSGECDDQLSLVARVGRGIKGNSVRVDIDDDSIGQATTKLKEFTYDEATKQWTPGWVSENINGGRLHCYYHLNTTDDPQTFQMIFIYKRPGRKDSEWSFVTPAIPYSYYDRNNNIVGSTVGTVFLKDHIYNTGTSSENDKYNDMLTYPGLHDEETIDREDFNAPYPPGGLNKITNKDTVRKGDKRKTNSTFLPHGSEWNVYLDLCEFNEFATIAGLANSDDEEENRKVCTDILNGIKEVIIPSERNSADWTTFDDIKSDTIKDYIDDMIEAEATARGTKDRDLQDQIDALKERVRKLEQYVSALAQANNTAFQQLLNRIFGSKNGHAGTATITETDIPSGTTTLTKIPEVSITWDGLASGEMIPIGNMNINSNPGSDSTPYPYYLKTHSGDVRGDVREK